MTRLRSLLSGGLTATAALWTPVEAAYDWVFRAAAILANVAGGTGAAVKASYRGLLGAMARHAAVDGDGLPAPEMNEVHAAVAVDIALELSEARDLQPVEVELAHEEGAAEAAAFGSGFARGLGHFEGGTLAGRHL